MRYIRPCAAAMLLLCAPLAARSQAAPPSDSLPATHCLQPCGALPDSLPASHCLQPCGSLPDSLPASHCLQPYGALPDSLPPFRSVLPCDSLPDSLPAFRSVLSCDSLPPLRTDSVNNKGIFRKIWNYFKGSNKDRTLEKKFDFSFILGPSYSEVTKFTIGFLAAGLYRVDRTDSLTPPSDVSLYGNVSTSGFFALGVSGTTIFDHNRYRLVYDLSFSSMPTGFYGVGYDAGRYKYIDAQGHYTDDKGVLDHGGRATAGELVMKRYRIRPSFTYTLLPNLYVGATVDFGYYIGKKFRNVTIGDGSDTYLGRQHKSYMVTGLGLVAEYDSRDYIPNPYKGVLVRLEQNVYPAALGTNETFWKTRFTFDAYHKVWQGGVLAYDFYLERNSDKQIPWCTMAELGGGYRMRGYYQGRYRDKSMIETQVELRQRIWRRNGIALWVGAGNVFPRFGAFNWKHTLPNFGIGYRWEFKNRVNIRVDYGFGKKCSGLNFNINEAF